MRKNSIGVLVSGGLDSSVLVAEMAKRYKNVFPIYIRQGVAWENAELYWLRRFLLSFRRKPESTIDPGFRRGDVKSVTVLVLPLIDLYGAHWSTGKKTVPGARTRDSAVYLPGRNLTLSVKAAVFCSMNGISKLAIGSLDHNPFPDASLNFFRIWGKALSQGLAHPIRILAPYRNLSKAEVIRRGKRWPLELSFSCIAPKGKWHCGRCNKCAERRRAFKSVGVVDKTKYVA